MFFSIDPPATSAQSKIQPHEAESSTLLSPPSLAATSHNTNITHAARNTPFRSKSSWKLLIAVLLLASGIAAGWFGSTLPTRDQPDGAASAADLVSLAESDAPRAVVLEAYQVIKDNYWEVMTDEQLSALFFAAITHVAGTQPELQEKNQAGINALLEQVWENTAEESREQLAAQVIDLVASNLQPMDRSRLYTQQDTQALAETVSNIDPESDLFSVIEVEKDADNGEVATAVEEKLEAARASDLPETEKQQELEQIERAAETLSNAEARARYQETQIETTISGKQLTSDIFYLAIKQFSPTTVEDLRLILQQGATAASQPPGKPTTTVAASAAKATGTALIIDLRGNIGGAIDGLPYFLGPFVGPNNFAYQFSSRGHIADFKTKSGWLPELVQFKRTIILIDENTQSTAEVMAASLKKYQVGVVIGSASKGWGTVERAFPFETKFQGKQKYSLFLVHSLTLDESGQPIEGNGVVPDISLQDTDWQEKLFTYFRDQELVNQVEQLSR